jgi:hypothetical protein
MAFKLGNKRPNVLKIKGLLNNSPFKASGNTMAYSNGPGDEKTEEQKKADAKAKKEAQANMKVVRTETNKVDGGTETINYLEGEGKGRTYAEAGVDPAEAQKYWDDHPDEYEEYKANKKLKDQNRTFVPDEIKPPEIITTTENPKHKEKFDYEGKPDEPTEITTTENPKPKPKTQDYIAGKGDKVFVPQETQRAMKLSKALTGKADSFGFKNVKGKKLQKLKDEHDVKVLASRAKQGKMGAETLTIAEQEAKGLNQINKKGAGRSSIVDTKSGEGIRKGETAMKDAQGNMMYVNQKKGTSRPASPENDLPKVETEFTSKV